LQPVKGTEKWRAFLTHSDLPTIMRFETMGELNLFHKGMCGADLPFNKIDPPHNQEWPNHTNSGNELVEEKPSSSEEKHYQFWFGKKEEKPSADGEESLSAATQDECGIGTEKKINPHSDQMREEAKRIVENWSNALAERELKISAMSCM
jgi:hypothetical protein